MSFLNPLLLAAGIAGLAIPIIVHLQRRRRKVRVVFSSLRLIEESQRITRKRRRITDWPILLLRCLAVILLALVFGRPWLQSLAGTSAHRQETVVYVLDRSASLHATGEVGRAWDEAINSMTRALSDSHLGSRVTLVATPLNDSATQITWMNPNQLLSEVKQLSPGFGRADLASALNRANGALSRIESDIPKVIHLISDLQTDAIRNLDRVTLASNIAIRVTKVGDLAPYNVGLTASAKGRGELRRGVYAVRGPESGVTVSGRFSIQDFDPQGEPVGEPTNVTVKPGTLTVSKAYAAGRRGWYARRIRLEQEDALDIDNEVVDAFYVQSRVNVLLVEPAINAETFNQVTFFFSRALDPFLGEADKSKRPTRFIPSTVSVRQSPEAIRQLDPTSSVVFLPALKAPTAKLANALKQFVAQGGGLIAFSGDPLRPEIYNQYLGQLLPIKIGNAEKIQMRATLEFISQRHPLWGGLDISNRQKMIRLPLFRRSATELRDGATVLAKFADGQSFVTRKNYQAGSVLFVNTSATRQWTDWPAMAGSYVPTIHVLAALALPDTEGSQRNADVHVEFDASVNLELGTEFATKTVTIDGQEIEADNDGIITKKLLSAPNVYTIKDVDNRIIKKIAVNLDPRESNLESIQPVVVKRQLESQRAQADDASLAATSGEKNDGLIWKSVLATLAIVLAIEPLLANLA